MGTENACSLHVFYALRLSSFNLHWNMSATASNIKNFMATSSAILGFLHADGRTQICTAKVIGAFLQIF
jgi:hypothetical protein